VHVVGGTIPGGLLAAVRAAQGDTPVFSDEVPGTRILREPIAVDVRVAHSVHSAAHSAA
jgi:hypothetical protein